MVNHAKKKLSYPEEYIKVHDYFRNPNLTVAQAEQFLNVYRTSPCYGYKQAETISGYLQGALGYQNNISGAGGFTGYVQLMFKHYHPNRISQLYPNQSIPEHVPLPNAARPRSIANARALVASRNFFAPRSSTTAALPSTSTSTSASLSTSTSTSTAPSTSVSTSSSTSLSAPSTSSNILPPVPVLSPSPVSEFYLRDTQQDLTNEQYDERMKKLIKEEDQETLKIRLEQAKVLARRIIAKVENELELDETTTPRLSEVREGVETICFDVASENNLLSEKHLEEAIFDRVNDTPNAPWSKSQLQQLHSLGGWELVEKIAELYTSDDRNSCDAYIEAFIKLDGGKSLRKSISILKKEEERDPRIGRRTLVKKLEKILRDEVYNGLTRMTIDERHILSLDRDSRKKRSLSKYLNFPTRIRRYPSKEAALAREGGTEQKLTFSNAGAEADEIDEMDVGDEAEEGEDDLDAKAREAAEEGSIAADMEALGFGGGYSRFVPQDGHSSSQGSILINADGTIARVRIGTTRARKDYLVGVYEIIQTALHKPNLNINPGGDLNIGSVHEGLVAKIRKYGIEPNATIATSLSPPATEAAHGQTKKVAQMLCAAGRANFFSPIEIHEHHRITDVFEKGKKGSRQQKNTVPYPRTPEEEEGFKRRLEAEILKRKALGHQHIALLVMAPEILQILGIVKTIEKAGEGTYFGMEPQLFDFRGHLVTIFAGHQPNRNNYGVRKESRDGNAIVFALAAAWPSYASKILSNDPTYRDIRVALEDFIDEFDKYLQIARYKVSFTCQMMNNASPITSYPSPTYTFHLKPFPPKKTRSHRRNKLLVKALGHPLETVTLHDIGLAQINGKKLSIYEGTLKFQVTVKKPGMASEGVALLLDEGSDLRVCRDYLTGQGLSDEFVNDFETRLNEAQADPEGVLQIINNNGIRPWLESLDDCKNNNRIPFLNVREHPIFPHGTGAGGGGGANSNASNLPTPLIQCDESLKSQLAEKKRELANMMKLLGISDAESSQAVAPLQEESEEEAQIVGMDLDQ
ncbi:hypothetical protein JCM3765_002018 [Sporobolomyces pararoseus]